MSEYTCDVCRKKIDNTNCVLSSTYDIGDGIKMRSTESFFKEGSNRAMNLCIECHNEYLKKFLKYTVEKGRLNNESGNV